MARKRQTDWHEVDGTVRAQLFWHPGGPLPDEINTNRSRGVWVDLERGIYGRRWIARSWRGAYDELYRAGFAPCKPVVDATATVRPESTRSVPGWA